MQTFYCDKNQTGLAIKTLNKNVGYESVERRVTDNIEIMLMLPIVNTIQPQAFVYYE